MTLSRFAFVLLLASCADLDPTDPTAEVEPVDRTSPCPQLPPSPLRPTVYHNADINSSEIWAAGSTQIITSSLTIHAGVQIGACARVLLAGGTTLTIGSRGAVYALSDAFGGGVGFGRYDANPWSQIKVDGGFLSLVKATIGGGGVANGGELYVKSGSLLVQNTWISDAVGYGLDVDSSATIDPASSGLAISGAAAPIHVVPNLVGSLPGGNYTGNANDAIVAVPNQVQASQLWRDLGVPYQIGDGLVSGPVQVFDSNGGLTTLTLAQNVELRFKKDTSLMIEPLTGLTAARGALIAIGSPTKPITFTSAESPQQPGDWMGLWFGSTTDNSIVEWAGVLYAGGNSGSTASCPTQSTTFVNNGGILVLTGSPSSSFLVNDVVEHSAGNGIVRGWRGAPAPDFSMSNVQFLDIKFCRQTMPRATSGACLANPSC